MVDDSQSPTFSESDHQDVEDKRRLRAAVVYEVVRQEGEEELEREASALWWSGVAAGLTISFSVITQALLKSFLPDTDWTPLVADMGYSVGFLIVILARQQLFTENTITVVLPLMAAPSFQCLALIARLWGIVLLANFAGAAVVAAFLAYGEPLPAATMAAITSIGEHLFVNSPGEMFIKGIGAGWLIAALVWLLPSAEHMAFWMIGLITYVIALADFTHIVAGSVEAFFLLMTGRIDVLETLFGFALPTLAGNVVGGTVLFAMISYAQVRREIEADGD
ncbi:formate/nitrite transporter family protein [Denitrobaculum tricleocarpae]|uniref:Formate/nitrite transporter family protein n=1 Tax=Denitrobaculum tricleocarpae TaxID=2591009 RepID=A0A545SYQ3_9PROT|nr:formate/nitrite transporter family protein [Denitrobaculum tricleocarpae]TQV70095.1 formate/nitrite transporter family protein [Denitrobaculum tricleocarpae]